MVAVFYLCLTNSLNMALFILMLVLLEPLIKKYVSAVCLYRLWVILLIALLIPVRFEITKAFYYISPPRMAVEDNAFVEQEIQGSSDLDHVTGENDLVQEQLTRNAGAGKSSQERAALWKQLLQAGFLCLLQNGYVFLCLLWGLGAIILLTIKGSQYYACLRRLRRFMVPVKQEEFREVYGQCIRELTHKYSGGLRKADKIQVWKCSVITSPMTIGILRPKILLPEEIYLPKDLYFILKHELIHILRRDSLVKLIRLIVLALHWYNPFCYILYGHLEDWCETSCDEEVLSNSTRSDCISYGRLLLKSATVKNNTTALVNLYGGKNNMKFRLHSILNYRKKYTGNLLALLLLAVVSTTVIVATMNQTQASASDDSKITTEQSGQPAERAEAGITAAPDDSDRNPTEAVNQEDGVAASATQDVLTTATLRETIVEYAIEAEGTPFLWGGNDLNTGVDASGFTQAVFGEFGYELPRTSREQAAQYEEVSLDSLQPGDLIFYETTGDNKVSHVGIYIGNDEIIHAKNAQRGVVIEDMNYRTPFSAGRVITE